MRWGTRCGGPLLQPRSRSETAPTIRPGRDSGPSECQRIIAPPTSDEVGHPREGMPARDDPLRLPLGKGRVGSRLETAPTAGQPICSNQPTLGRSPTSGPTYSRKLLSTLLPASLMYSSGTTLVNGA